MGRSGYHSYRAGGIEMGHLPRRTPMGMDPNYRGGTYRGERFQEEEGSAAYGHYRSQHGRELGGFGGARGGATGAGMLRNAPPSQPSGPFGPPQPKSTVGLRGRQRPQAGPSRGAPRERGGRYDRSLRGGYGSDSYDREYRGAPAEPRPNPGRGGGGRFDGFNASRPLRYDGGLNRSRRYRGGGFSEGFLGSGF